MKKARQIKVPEDTVINISPIPADAPEGLKKEVLELQLKMATSSINHEYARIEFEDVDDYERREELLQFMNECHSEYLNARVRLTNFDPQALADFEADLLRQKQFTLSGFAA